MSFFFWNCDVEYLVNNILILANCLIHKFRFFNEFVAVAEGNTFRIEQSKSIMEKPE